jgi:tetratricopeptide (TPR) repeat protein
VAWSAIGQAYITQRKDTQALEAFRTAAPLLKPDATSYARNQYRMGFALINLKRIPEARTALTEAASVESPYRAMAQAKLKELPAAPARPGKKSS